MYRNQAFQKQGTGAWIPYPQRFLYSQMGWGAQQWIYICYFKSTQETLTDGPEGAHLFLSVFFWSPFGYFWGITAHLLDFWVLSWMGNKQKEVHFNIVLCLSIYFSLIFLTNTIYVYCRKLEKNQKILRGKSYL